MPTFSGTLDVPGGVLHYQVRGTGPLLLISESGEGDADRSGDLIDHLADTYSVATYDRRGLSRSRMDHPERGASLAEHADDVHRLLGVLADAPVRMLGCSLGAVIGLHVAVRHPGEIATLIAHEPVAPRLLPEGERSRHERELAALQDLYRREGLGAALPRIARTLGIDPTHKDAEPDLTPQPINERRTANFDYFIRHDFTAVIHDTIDVGAVKDVSARIIPAVGRTTPQDVFDRRCADALSALVGQETAEFPGGHNGNTSHPRAYATRLRQVLADVG
ncbi:alpha/beta hydrolase [Streptomyces sp. WAC07094]|uniref:alpha/beta fold hydrolase n=1 Tax=Streptomyces sp. WAC07094 TaxID=3072183 RepID=UPI002EC06BD5|nr:alpha/beta hydrolase [Streptomyces sp. WAC07094]